MTHVTVNARATSGAHSKSAQKLSHSLLLPLAQRRLPAIEVGTATSMMLMVRHNARGSRGPRRATGESTFGEDLPLSRAPSIHLVPGAKMNISFLEGVMRCMFPMKAPQDQVANLFLDVARICRSMSMSIESWSLYIILCI